jgi:TonB family protein
MTARTLVVFVSLVVLGAGLSAEVQAPTPQTVADPSQAPMRLGPGIQNPRLLRESRPSYPPEAMRAKIEGVVVLEAVILADGTVGDVRVMKSLDSVYGLDESAMAAAKRWLFAPATRQGVAVPVYATLELSFRILDEFSQALAPDTPGLVAPKALTTPQPDYTPAAGAANAQGTVEVEVVVLPNGRVSAARVSRSSNQQAGLESASGLERQAILAARQWTFEPATLDGKPVRALVTLTFDFRLR